MFADEGADVGDKKVKGPSAPSSPPPPPAPDADLSEQVMATIAREAGDRVRCTRIGLHKYRCNWWAPRPGAPHERGSVPGLASTTFRVRKSRMLYVTPSPTGLQITEAPARLQ